MKRAIGGILAAVLAAGCATGPALPPLEIASVHEVPGKSKQQLCNAARDWAAITFKDSKAVVEVFDAEQGKLIGKGRITLVGLSDMMPTDFTLVVECRDDRVRASYSQVQPYLKGQPYPLIEAPLMTLRSQADEKLKKLDADLAAYFKNPKLGGKW